MNNYTATGNIGRDCEYRAFPNGGGVLSFPLAVSAGYGERRTTLWIRCQLFGKRAEGGLREYLTKGQQLAVSGELSMNEWTNKEGVVQHTLELNLNQVDLIGEPRDKKPATQAHQTAGPEYQAKPAVKDDYLDDEIPFN